MQSEKLAQAEHEMKKIAFESVQIGLKTDKDGVALDRGPASESGSDEKTLTQADPWGGLYHVKVVRNPYGIATHLIVWSYGPNGAQDTRSIEPAAKSGAQAVIFDGDDIGYITAVH
jgi:hypothetical protein